MKEPHIKENHKLVALNYVGKCLGNAEKSVIAAGYSPKYARGNAHKIVARKDVQEYIKYLQSHPVEKEIYDLKQLREWWTEVIMSGSVKMSDRLRASEYLGRSLGAFKDDWT